MGGIGELGLLATGVGLGLRHGIDWDHIAAITDITSTTSGADEGDGGGIVVGVDGSGSLALGGGAVLKESWSRFFLATLYALGHASVVVALGLLALWASAILPSWVDPIMERAVGATLIALGLYIFYALWRYGRSYRLRSRWMLVFAAVGRGWRAVRARVTGRPHQHVHVDSQYSRSTAFGVGMIHGIGAETGSQALLLASAAGATTKVSGTALLLAFTIGLLLSNSLIAVLSTWGFVSTQTRQHIYVAIGVFAGVFSLAIGVTFVTGLGSDLPDIQRLLGAN